MFPSGLLQDADDGLILFDEDSGDVTFSSDQIGILSVNLNNINIENFFDEDDPDAIILIRFLTGHSKKLKNTKRLKKDN